MMGVGRIFFWFFMIIIFAMIIILFLENNVLEKFLLRMYNIMNYEIKFFRKIFITYIRYSTIMKSLYNLKKYFNNTKRISRYE